MRQTCDFSLLLLFLRFIVPYDEKEAGVGIIMMTILKPDMSSLFLFFLMFSSWRN